MSFGLKAAQRLAGKTVLITGASSGIGAATALELATAAKGDLKLILAARRSDRLADLKSKLEKEFSSIKIHTSSLDVSKYREVPDWVKSLPSEFANVDVLVNNAGLCFGRDKVGTLELAEYEGMYLTNVLGLISLTNAIVPQMRKRGTGDIVMMGSIAGREGYPEGSVYCGTKMSVKAFSQSLRKEVIDTDIRVIEIDPGMVETEFSVVRFRGDSSAAGKVYDGIEPLIAEDIADLITFALTRRTNTVIAETLIFPNHQASARDVYKTS